MRPTPWGIQGLGTSSGPAFSFLNRGAPGIHSNQEAPMRNLHLDNPARAAQDHISDTYRNGPGEIPGSTTSLKMDMLPVEALRPYANNARTHSKKQINQIAKSIRQFGFCNPVLIDDQGQIIAGHGRVAAAKVLGIGVVPTVR